MIVCVVSPGYIQNKGLLCAENIHDMRAFLHSGHLWPQMFFALQHALKILPAARSL